MTIKEVVEKLAEIDDLMLTEVGLELTDYARERAHICIVSAIEHLQENYEEY